jgi:manganese/zinc/iron transport system substrate-binding protein
VYIDPLVTWMRPMRRIHLLTHALAALLLVLAGCRPAGPSGRGGSGGPLRVVTTTSMLADLVRNIGGEHVTVAGLMGPGVDPHLYQASEGDVTRLMEADLIVYNGLHLEGKMTEIFAQMRQRNAQTFAVAEEGIAAERRRQSPTFAGNYDPHVWFDVTLWMEAARYVERVLAGADTAHAAAYAANARAYLEELARLEAYVREQAARVPEAQRALITSHDAFGYFGRAYGFEVRGLQGISTAAEAGTADVQALAAFVAERRIPALFVESSVSPRGIEAVREAVRSRGFEVQLGGTLYGDALGGPDSGADTYVGMVRHNIDTIVAALSARATS